MSKKTKAWIFALATPFVILCWMFFGGLLSALLGLALVGEGPSTNTPTLAAYLVASIPFIFGIGVGAFWIKFTIEAFKDAGSNKK